MGRYTYNSGVVTSAITELNDAMNSLANVTTEIQAGINTITNATGAQCVEIDYSKLLQLQTMAEDVIDEDIRTIQQKVTIIEEYENAPWYKKLFSSIGMGLTKFVEGVVSGVENITDGAVSIVGFVGGIFNSEFKNSVAEYVAKDHVGDWFNKQYDEGFLSGVSKYSWFSEDSTCANIFKGFGTAAPYIALSFVGGGVGMYTEMAAAGLGGIGSGTEAGINKALMNDPNLKAGDVFNKAFGQGIVQGAKNAGMVYLMHKISQTAKTNVDGRKNIQTPSGTKYEGTSMGANAAANNRALKKVSDNVANSAFGKGLQASDDFLAAGGQKVGNLVGKIPGAQTAKNIFGRVAGNSTVQKVTNAIGKAATTSAATHPMLTTALAGSIFTLDQIDEDVINSEYRVQQEQIGSVTVRPTPTLTPTPPTTTIQPTPVTTAPSIYTTTPVSTTPAVTTPSGTKNPNTTQSSGTGSGYYPTATSSTPVPVTQTATVTVTETVITPTATTVQPTPTSTTVQPTYTYTSTSYPTPTSSTNGGGYTEEGYTGEGGTEGEFNFDTDTEDMAGSFTEIVGGNEYTNIPTSSTPITATTTTGTKKSIIPVIAGLGSAAVAGIGAKAFLDKKEESNSSDEEFDAEEWTEEDSLDIEYNEAMEEDRDYLNPSDEYAYQEGGEEPNESYSAVNSSELASMQ